MRISIVSGSIGALTALMLTLNFAQAQTLDIFPEQRTLNVRGPSQFAPAAVPETAVPFTVADKTDDRQERLISLDEAIQIAIANADVIRVLTGLSATSSGRTIYDVAISNTGIDLQNAVFDPTFDWTTTLNKTDRPGATFDPLNLGRSTLIGSSTDSVNTTISLSKRMFNGGTAGLNANAVGSYFEPGVFEYRSFVELTLSQPLARGYGRDANLAPVLIARIDTERSYFQFKDTVQELVRGVIEAYWNLVASRVDVWARQQQIDQAEFAYERAVARKQQGLDRAADVAQARSALANFKAGLLTARSTMILAETALRNILGLDPSSTEVFVPSSLPTLEQVDFDWDEIVRLGEQYRPDIIERKLILEADQYSQVQANNQARPQFDGIMNYRWDGLSGEMPDGTFLNNDPGRFAGFNVGVNFSVPLGLRQSRASLRRSELIIAQDKLVLEQSIFQMVQQLTINYRNLDQFFEQYVAFKEVREAARINFENQVGEVAAGRREFLNALQAITDWGNAVSQEARSITQYNTELANVERQTGTILETHGIRFLEERYGSVGPQGLFGARRSTECYPESLRVDGTTDQYPESESNSDEAFNLEDLDVRGQSRRGIPDSEYKEPQPRNDEAPRLEIETERSGDQEPAKATSRLGSPMDFVVQPPAAATETKENRARLIDMIRLR